MEKNLKETDVHKGWLYGNTPSQFSCKYVNYSKI